MVPATRGTGAQVREGLCAGGRWRCRASHAALCSTAPSCTAPVPRARQPAAHYLPPLQPRQGQTHTGPRA
jgi:hypothetical protein